MQAFIYTPLAPSDFLPPRRFLFLITFIDSLLTFYKENARHRVGLFRQGYPALGSLLTLGALQTIPMIRYSDPLDEAAELAASLVDSAVSAVRSRNVAESHPDFDGTHCLDCDDPIPKPRLDLGKIRCVDCQSDLEREAQRRV